jgi:hypothetical protein
MIKTRSDAVKGLVNFCHSLDEIGACLVEFRWDYEGIPTELNRTHLTRVLKRYLSRELSESDVERWANMLEGREDTCFEKGAEAQLELALLELANPTLTTPLDGERATAMIEALSK